MTKPIISLTLLSLCMWSSVAQALTVSTETDGTISGQEVLLFLHLLLFVFWIGPDIGRYIWSTQAADSQLSPNTRISAGELVNKIDLFPRVCISLTLTVAGILTEAMGIAHPWWQMIGILLLGPVWLSMVLITHFSAGTPFGKRIYSVDVWFRLFIAAAVLTSVSHAWSTGQLDETPWVAGKLVLFAVILLLGLLMRQQLKPFDAGLAKLKAEGPSERVDLDLRKSIIRARPYIFGIWVAIGVAVWLGVAQPTRLIG